MPSIRVPSFSNPAVISAIRGAADLVLENDIAEILRQSRDGQHVCFSFHVSPGCDACVEGFRLVPDGAEVTGRELALFVIGADSRCSLEQPLPTARAGALARGHL